MQTNNAIQGYDDLPLNIRELVETHPQPFNDDAKNIITGTYKIFYRQDPETANENLLRYLRSIGLGIAGGRRKSSKQRKLLKQMKLLRRKSLRRRKSLKQKK